MQPDISGSDNVQHLPHITVRKDILINQSPSLQGPSSGDDQTRSSVICPPKILPPADGMQTKSNFVSKSQREHYNDPHPLMEDRGNHSCKSQSVCSNSEGRSCEKNYKQAALVNEKSTNSKGSLARTEIKSQDDSILKNKISDIESCPGGSCEKSEINCNNKSKEKCTNISVPDQIQISNEIKRDSLKPVLDKEQFSSGSENKERKLQRSSSNEHLRVRIFDMKRSGSANLFGRENDVDINETDVRVSKFKEGDIHQNAKYNSENTEHNFSENTSATAVTAEISQKRWKSPGEKKMIANCTRSIRLESSLNINDCDTNKSILEQMEEFNRSMMAISPKIEHKEDSLDANKVDDSKTLDGVVVLTSSVMAEAGENFDNNSSIVVPEILNLTVARNVENNVFEQENVATNLSGTGIEECESLTNFADKLKSKYLSKVESVHCKKIDVLCKKEDSSAKATSKCNNKDKKETKYKSERNKSKPKRKRKEKKNKNKNKKGNVSNNDFSSPYVQNAEQLIKIACEETHGSCNSADLKLYNNGMLCGEIKKVKTAAERKEPVDIQRITSEFVMDNNDCNRHKSDVEEPHTFPIRVSSNITDENIKSVKKEYESKSVAMQTYNVERRTKIVGTQTERLKIDGKHSQTKLPSCSMLLQSNDNLLYANTNFVESSTRSNEKVVYKASSTQYENAERKKLKTFGTQTEKIKMESICSQTKISSSHNMQSETSSTSKSLNTVCKKDQLNLAILKLKEIDCEIEKLLKSKQKIYDQLNLNISDHDTVDSKQEKKQMLKRSGKNQNPPPESQTHKVRQPSLGDKMDTNSSNVCKFDEMVHKQSMYDNNNEFSLRPTKKRKQTLLDAEVNQLPVLKKRKKSNHNNKEGPISIKISLKNLKQSAPERRPSLEGSSHKSKKREGSMKKHKSKTKFNLSKGNPEPCKEDRLVNHKYLYDLHPKKHRDVKKIDVKHAEKATFKVLMSGGSENDDSNILIKQEIDENFIVLAEPIKSCHVPLVRYSLDQLSKLMGETVKANADLKKPDIDLHPLQEKDVNIFIDKEIKIEEDIPPMLSDIINHPEDDTMQMVANNNISVNSQLFVEKFESTLSDTSQIPSGNRQTCSEMVRKCNKTIQIPSESSQMFSENAHISSEDEKTKSTAIEFSDISGSILTLKVKYLANVYIIP